MKRDTLERLAAWFCLLILLVIGGFLLHQLAHKADQAHAHRQSTGIAAAGG